MATSIQTRRAAAVEEQLKLKNALRELKSLKDLNDQLLREREDSEVELTAIIAKNTKLKAELADLNSAHALVLEERDELHEAVSSFNSCINTYDEALTKISMLENELSRAHKTIDDLQSQLQNYETQSTNNLYNEVLASSSSVPEMIVDLTCDSDSKPPRKQDGIRLNSHKKLKKYIRISKLINKTKKSIKMQKAHSTNIALHKERFHLLNKLHTYCSTWAEVRKKYEGDIRSLNEEISVLNNSLKNISMKYEMSQGQLDEQVLAADELLALGTYNLARFESLRNKCQCISEVPTDSKINNSMLLPDSLGTCLEGCTIKCAAEVPSGLSGNLSANPEKQTIIISDKLGRDFGSCISYYMQHSVINRCSPGATLDYLLNTLCEENLDCNKNVIILFGDSLKVKRSQIIKCVEKLVQLNTKTKCKFFMCAFPYSSSLTQKQNQHIHMLNLMMYNLTYRHSDAIFCFDINKFTSKFILTGENMHLPKRCKLLLASLLAYNIHDSVTSSVTMSFDSYTNSTLSTNNISIVDSSNSKPIACLN